jgi:programmed cell death 6-interacting protein
MEPLMFEDASDQELAKYDKFLVELRELEEKQNVVLMDIKVREASNNWVAKCLSIGIQKEDELFLQSRLEDPAVKDREFALQSLELSYFKYKDIIRNLEEGYKVNHGRKVNLAGSRFLTFHSSTMISLAC